MHSQGIHGSMAASPLCQLHCFQTLLGRPLLPHTRFGSFKTLQRCVDDARGNRRRSCRLRCSLSTAAPNVVHGTASEGTIAAEQTSTLPVSTAYPFTHIEAKWQEYWLRNKTFRTPDLAELDTSKPKAYILDMFPYPSGAGLHVGHPAGYTATDILARLRRMQGYNVLHPIGWDAFGLPAEQYAIQTGTHPRVTTEKNINRFRQQLQSLGFSYDWDREVSTTSPEYYKWTQWIFCQLFKRGLAYQAEVPVNWCPALGTVLANEEVIDGKSERGDHPVVRLPMKQANEEVSGGVSKPGPHPIVRFPIKQWMLRITEYADRLLEDLEGLDWPDSIKDMQRNWIGRSEGATIQFAVQGGAGASVAQDAFLEVFTTRPDTIFGATYMVIAPEHPLLESLSSSAQQAAVQEYVVKAAQKSDLERTELQKVKSGVDTGSFAINPATGKRVPIWVADYVLGTYGSGAIMAVPAHDTRDREFAQQYGLPIIQVVKSPEGETEQEIPFTGKGTAVSSSNQAEGLRLDGLGTEEAAAAVVRWLQEKGRGNAQTNYKLRDWLFARQRYWGEPFPIVFEEGSEEPQAVPETELPLTLPETDNFKPSGSPESPLANVSDWVSFTDPKTGKRYRRETSTMPQWAGSCWYYLRYLQPWNTERPVDPEVEQYWLPVDLYVGGAEHAVLHLLYARFWHKVLYDIGVVTRKEPFQSLVSQGMILGEVEYTVYRDQDGNLVDESHPSASASRLDESEVDKKGNGYVLKSDPSVRVSSRAHKMSKSRGNVVNPDDVVTMYGADSLRLYEMFMGPLRDTKVWSTNQVEGVHRFLARSYRLVTGENVTENEPSKEQLRSLHIAIKRVTEETEQMRFNTGISALMEFVNAAYKWDAAPKSVLRPFVLLLAPYAPHIAEELWQVLGKQGTLAYEQWPSYDEKLLVSDSFNLPIQVNGKLRGTVEVAKGIHQGEAEAVAREQEGVAKFLDGKELKKVIFVPGRILNFIVSK